MELGRFTPRKLHTIKDSGGAQVLLAGLTRAEALEQEGQSGEWILAQMLAHVLDPEMTEPVWPDAAAIEAALSQDQIEDLTEAFMRLFSPKVADRLFRNGAGPVAGAEHPLDGEDVRGSSAGDPARAGG